MWLPPCQRYDKDDEDAEQGLLETSVQSNTDENCRNDYHYQGTDDRPFVTSTSAKKRGPTYHHSGYTVEEVLISDREVSSAAKT